MRKKKDKDTNLIVRQTLSFMFKTVRKNKPVLFFVYIIQLVMGFLGTMLSVIMPKFIIDEVVLILSGEVGNTHIWNAVIYAVIMVSGSLIVRMSDNLTSNLIGYYGEWFNQYFETEISHHAMTMDFEHTEDPEALDKLEKAKEGMSWYSGGVCGIMDAFFKIVRNLAIIFGVSVVILFTCPLLLPLQLIALLLITYFNARINKLEEGYFMKLSGLNRVFGYVLYGLSDPRLGKDIRLYNSADMMCQKAEEYNEKSVNAWKNQSLEVRPNTWGGDVVNALRDGLSYFYIGYKAITGAISIGDFTMCVSSASSIYWGMHGVVSAVQDLRKRCRYAHRYLEFEAYPAAMEKGDKMLRDVSEHTIEFKNVSFRYPRTEKYILKNVSIKIKSGEHLSVVGLNGAGKTTFIKLLCRLYDVTDGEILVDGINIREYSDEQYRRLFAVVFQDFRLFAFSMRENVALNAEADDEKIRKTLGLSGLSEDLSELEHGLDTVLFKSFDEKGTELSGGQQQKTAIARALYKNAPVVILDEPTAALDPVAEYDVYRQFDTLVGGKTAIYISHRLSSCKFCDKIAVFSEGGIKEYGTHDELVSVGGVYAQMFEAQAQYYRE